MRGFWTCQRVTGGVRCGQSNPNRVRICRTCGKTRPPRKRPAHMAALDLDYAGYVELNGGNRCGVCGRGPSKGRRLDRDHDHRVPGGLPRGLLCARCNRALPSWVTPEWLRAAAEYVERSLLRG